MHVSIVDSMLIQYWLVRKIRAWFSDFTKSAIQQFPAFDVLILTWFALIKLNQESESISHWFRKLTNFLICFVDFSLYILYILIYLSLMLLLINIRWLVMQLKNKWAVLDSLIHWFPQLKSMNGNQLKNQAMVLLELHVLFQVLKSRNIKTRKVPLPLLLTRVTMVSQVIFYIS